MCIDRNSEEKRINDRESGEMQEGKKTQTDIRTHTHTYIDSFGAN